VRIVIVGKTRMRGGRVCVGAHDLDSFRSLRLSRHDGTYVEEDAALEIGDIWEVDYRDRPGTTPPHVEDVIVAEGGTRRGRQADLGRLIAQRDVVWTSVDELFDGGLAFTAAGTAYIPVDGRLPARSTGYWRIDSELTHYTSYGRPRYRWGGDGPLRSAAYVGVADPADRIPAGTLVRLSLSHAQQPPNQPNGYWLQLSGWFTVYGGSGRV
jgi:hypothetical protein